MYPELPNGHGNENIHAFLTRRIETQEGLLTFSKSAHRRWDGENRTESDEDELVQSMADPVRIEHITEDYSYILNCSALKKTVLAGEDMFTVDPDEMLVVFFSEIEQRIQRSQRGLLLQLKDNEITTCINALDFYSRNGMEAYKDGCKHLNLAANVCGYIPVNLGKLIKYGILSDIDSIHRQTIDKAVERREKKIEDCGTTGKHLDL